MFAICKSIFFICNFKILATDVGSSVAKPIWISWTLDDNWGKLYDPTYIKILKLIFYLYRYLNYNFVIT